MLFAMVNILRPATKFSAYYKIITSAMPDVSEYSVMYAVKEAVAENWENDMSHITACFGGSWQIC